MRVNWPSDDDCTGNCLVCDRNIDYETGVVLDLSSYPHVCRECWAKLSVAEKLELVAQWRLLEKQVECLDVIVRLAEASLGGLWNRRGDAGDAGMN
jgi:hypothetical protein